jgi:hypothetical protein
MGEGDAMRYLSRESYLFAAYAYRTLFPKRVDGARDGEYANLDFGDLQRHYAGEMPIWVLLELSSFGTVADVYRFCANRWGDAAMLDEHYMLKKARDVRNACAHSAAIINGLGSNGHVARPAPSELTMALREAGFSKRSRSSRMRNPRLQQIATLLLLHRRMAEGTALADEASAHLRPLATDVRAVLSATRPDAAAEASMEFLADLVDRWF